MAAPSLVPSACTAGGPATTSVVSVSACQDTLEPCATKVPATNGAARAGDKGQGEGRVQGVSSNAAGIRKQITMLLKGQEAQRGHRSHLCSHSQQVAEMNSDSNILLKKGKKNPKIQPW